MTTQYNSSSTSRRTALAGLGAGALGVSLAAAHHASAQDATPSEMAAHPIVGTWIIDRDITTATEASVTDLKSAIERAGFAVAAGTFASAGGRVSGEFTVSPR